MPFVRNPLLALGAAAVMTVAVAAPALAQSAAVKAEVDQAKTAGVVGEQADGFLGFVGSPNGAVRAAVAEINAGRAAAYRQAATRTGVSAAAAGEATAQQLFARMPAGEYFKPAGGSWQQK